MSFKPGHKGSQVFLLYSHIIFSKKCLCKLSGSVTQQCWIGIQTSKDMCLVILCVTGECYGTDRVYRDLRYSHLLL